ncbi:MAG: hypothetical protein ACI9DM_000245 [Cyclobacteriaceae bacterium]|jgi:hypothetical protein
MITNENFKHLLQTLNPERIQAEIDSPEDYILFNAHTFNVGTFATIQSRNYNEEDEQEASDTGNLFCDKDSFLQLIEETEAFEC